MRVAPSLRSRLLRVAKAVLLAGAGWAARLLHRLSPRTFSVLFSELRDLVRRTSAADSFVLRLGDTRFRLHVVADRPLASSTADGRRGARSWSSSCSSA